jgi:hypothetical protein
MSPRLQLGISLPIHVVLAHTSGVYFSPTEQKKIQFLTLGNDYAKAMIPHFIKTPEANKSCRTSGLAVPFPINGDFAFHIVNVMASMKS